MPLFRDRHEPKSLRTRYFTRILWLAATVITLVLIFYNNTISTRVGIQERLSLIQHDHHLLNSLKIELLDIYRYIDLFLLDPSEGEHIDNTLALLTSSLQTIDKFSSMQNAGVQSQPDEVRRLANNYEALRNGITDLAALRMDIRRQYPGLALSAYEMTGPQHAVSNSLQILIDEIESDNLQPASPELYPHILKSHTLWTRLIAQLRIYLANRLASFSTDNLVLQAASLGDMHRQFFNHIDTLELLYSNEDSFEAETALVSLRENSSEWYGLFQQVRKMSESVGWRGDSHSMKTVIIPLTDDISGSIASIEHWLVSQEEVISVQLQQSGNALNTLLATIIGLFLLFSLVLIFSMDLMVFRPIASITAALRSKASNHELPAIIASDSMEIRYLIEAFQQMDEEVDRRQDELQHQALHDHLTGLPNRFMLTQRIEYQLLTAERSDREFTIFLMDLNNFKDVNDSLGHAVGDRLLVKVADNLTQCIRKADTVARLGGDEFAILLPETGKDESRELAGKILNLMQQPLTVDENSVTVGVSIGVVSYPADGTDTMSLLQHADISMYHAKRYKTGFSFYNADEDFYQANRLSLVTDLRQAIDNNTLLLHYQPQVDTESQQVTGIEALLRWNHPEHGYIQPDKVVEIAEYAGIIHKLSGWVIGSAIAQCAMLHKAGHRLTISVNLSVHDLLNPNLVQQIASLLEQHGLEPCLLTLEITESGMMENPARSIDILQILSDMGINLAIDDFGTGFSSLSYLKKLPVNMLKIDKSFVLDMDESESDRVIVQSTIQLGHNLGLTVTAEGIENRAQLDIVTQLGCDQVQGYLFGKPQTIEELKSFLGENSGSDPCSDELLPSEQSA